MILAEHKSVLGTNPTKWPSTANACMRCEMALLLVRRTPPVHHFDVSPTDCDKHTCHNPSRCRAEL